MLDLSLRPGIGPICGCDPEGPEGHVSMDEACYYDSRVDSEKDLQEGSTFKIKAEYQPVCEDGAEYQVIDAVDPAPGILEAAAIEGDQHGQDE